MSAHHIITEDTRKDTPYRSGEVVTDTVARKLSADVGVSMLPVTLELITVGALSGYFRREYGQGKRLSDVAPMASCPLALYLSTAHNVLHWQARIVAEGIDAGVDLTDFLPFDGSLRLISDSGQGIAAATIGATPDSVFQFSKLNADNMIDGGWVIGGSVRVRASNEGVYGFALYGSGPGFRVLWSAITQTD